MTTDYHFLFDQNRQTADVRLKHLQLAFDDLHKNVKKSFSIKELYYDDPCEEYEPYASHKDYVNDEFKANLNSGRQGANYVYKSLAQMENILMKAMRDCNIQKIELENNVFKSATLCDLGLFAEFQSGNTLPFHDVKMKGRRITLFLDLMRAIDQQIAEENAEYPVAAIIEYDGTEEPISYGRFAQMYVDTFFEQMEGILIHQMDQCDANLISYTESACSYLKLDQNHKLSVHLKGNLANKGAGRSFNEIIQKGARINLFLKVMSTLANPALESRCWDDINVDNVNDDITA